MTNIRVFIAVVALLLGGLAAHAEPPKLDDRERVEDTERRAGDDAAKDCCKICRKGKACGDSCIAKNKICRKPPGCACDG